MDRLRGTIERITYHNEENGYTVAQLEPEAKSYTITVVGNMLGVHVGESVELGGAWTAHPQYGRQFRVETVRTMLPATVVGLERYLGSGLIKGIGPVTAKRIVRKFGLDTLHVIEEEPQRLRDVLGVGPKRIRTITRAWEEQKHIQEVMVFLQSHNVSTGLAVKIFKAYGNDAIATVKADPYRLARDIYGIGFITADRIARELGIAADAPERVAAGAAYVLSQAADEGNVYLPTAELIARASELLQVDPGLIEQAIVTLAAEDEVHIEDGHLPPAHSMAEDGRSQATGSRLAEERAVYLTPFFYGELGVTNRLRRIVECPENRLQVFQSFDWPAAFSALQARLRIALTPRQQDAVRAALTHRVTVLTGGPGTGKTTTTCSIIRLAEAAGKRVALASPTGRAAKRLSEATGRPAKTIHRLLEFKPAEGFSFQRNEENPLEADLVIVDEASMLDLLLTNNLLKAIAPGCNVLFVGDIDQLPSVGAGTVLHDLIAAIEGSPPETASTTRDSRGDSPAGPIPGASVIRLDTIFRQPEGSYIITNAHRINHGQMPILDNRSARDFFLFKQEDAELAAKLVVELVRERVPRKFGLSPKDIQVLSPMHRGPAGVAALNAQLQEQLNPARPGLPEYKIGGRILRQGDRVMQIRNNYDKEVFNGDMGRVLKVDLEDQVLLVQTEERQISYDFLELDELVHAYAISIHKAQGSEFPAVVIPLLPAHYVMLQRNLLYTAVTRAQRLVVLVGSPRAIAIAVRSNRTQARFSGLAERLQASLAGAPHP